MRDDEDVPSATSEEEGVAAEVANEERRSQTDGRDERVDEAKDLGDGLPKYAATFSKENTSAAMEGREVTMFPSVVKHPLRIRA